VVGVDAIAIVALLPRGLVDDAVAAEREGAVEVARRGLDGRTRVATLDE